MMGFTIEDALNETKELYQLTLLCGQKGCANAYELGSPY